VNPRLPTIYDELFPESIPEFANIADAWSDHVVEEMLALVWEGFDRMKALPRFSELDFRGEYAQIERSLTDLHMDEITILWGKKYSKFESFIPKHEPWEFHSLSTRSARPPSCDLGFVLVSNRRMRWSVEAKVVKSPSDINEYLEDLQKYLDGRTSPLSREAALGAYLIAGNAMDMLRAIELALTINVSQHAKFPHRPHGLTFHQRSTAKLPAGISGEFLCHHLVFSLS
jgi:hypothetical protein